MNNEEHADGHETGRVDEPRELLHSSENWSLNISTKPLSVMAVTARIMVQAKSFCPTLNLPIRTCPKQT